MKTNNNVITIIIVAVVVGGLGFFSGMKYQETKGRGGNALRQFQGANGRGSGQNGGARTGGGVRPVNGEILSADATSITVKLADGSSKIVLLNDKTSINKASEGSRDELKTGVTVAAFGTENADGSITASNIQLNPMFGRMGGGPNVR